MILPLSAQLGIPHGGMPQRVRQDVV
jgi:hypothetical protein